MWRDVCSLLPVKRVDVSKATFRDAARAFPNATSLSVAVDSGWSADDLSECLAAFPRLKHLSLHSTNFEVDHHGPDWLDGCSLPARVPFLSQLESLTLNSIPVNDESWISLVGTCLTNLTHLQISGDSAGGWLNAHPLSETHRLKSLTIHAAQLFNRKGRLIFPPSAHLTHFDIKAGCLFGEDPFAVQHSKKDASLHETAMPA